MMRWLGRVVLDARTVLRGASQERRGDKFRICTTCPSFARMIVAMTGYGQFCPIAKAAQILAERWTPLVLRELICGSTRFNDLRRGVPLMSSSLLSQRLKFLEREGVIERWPAAAGHGFEYHLTAAGRELEPMIMLMGEWGARWVRSQLAPEDLDVTLLMWDMRRKVRPEQFPARRVVVAFEFSDVPQSKRRWWLVSEGKKADLCVTDPATRSICPCSPTCAR